MTAPAIVPKITASRILCPALLANKTIKVTVNIDIIAIIKFIKWYE